MCCPLSVIANKCGQVCFFGDFRRCGIHHCDKRKEANKMEEKTPFLDGAAVGCSSVVASAASLRGPIALFVVGGGVSAAAVCGFPSTVG